MMNRPFIPFSRNMVCLAIAAAWLSPAMAQNPPSAQALNFSYAPATNTHKPPAPNVIISVDDSGSMSTQDGGGKSPTRMAVLKSALQETFTERNVPNESIRLGWMSMNACTGSGDKLRCPGTSPSIKVLDDTVRSSFLSWVNNTLKAEGGTPAHRMLYRAGEYLKTDKPWATYPSGSVPVGKKQDYLGCRRSYNVFLTDGSWNLPDVTNSTEWTTYYGPGWLNDTPLIDLEKIGNSDGDKTRLEDGKFPDGTLYNTNSEQTAIYRDQYGSLNYSGSGKNRKFTSYPTLSDLAFHYWATDLQPSIKENSEDGKYTLKPQIRHSGLEQVNSGSKTLNLQEYWNPKNNPATWPHMTMFTVGFGPGAALTVPKFGNNTWDLEVGDYKRLLTGQGNWGNPDLAESKSGNYAGTGEPARRAELWHAAINSRGTFVPVNAADDLATAFRTILNQIIAENTLPMTSVTLTANTLRRDSNMFVSSYNPADWSGSVTAYAVEAQTGVVNTTPLWNTATTMDANKNFHTNRKVFSHNGSAGIEFKWNSLSLSQKNALKEGSASITDALGTERLNYLRGQDVKGKGIGYRLRESIHGDIVNSKSWYYNGDATYLNKTGKKSNASEQNRRIIYVGANDGMLHAFNANDEDKGSEAFAYVPLGVYEKLPELIKPNYIHTYYVDGSPFVSEVKIGDAWKDYLVGTLGAGGKGFFILDVTNPTGFSTSDVKMDKTDGSDADIGYIFSEPTTDQASPTDATQLTQLNDGRWAFVTGNGYNSTNQNSVLLIQYLDGTLKKLSATPANKADGNGMSAPRLIDLSGDGIPDVAYAGDLSGNLWKFDLTCADNDSFKKTACANHFKVALEGEPLFTAKDALGQVQPITMAPAFIRHPKAPGLILSFGTGQNLTNVDRTTTYQQTLYGIHDRTGWTVSGARVVWTTLKSTDDEWKYRTTEYPIPRNELQEMTLTSTTDTDGNAAWQVTGEVDYSPEGSASTSFHKGWYLNLPVSKSRALANIEWVRGELFRLRFTVPAEGGEGGTTDLIETCEAVYSAREDYVGLFNIVSGKSYKSNQDQFYFVKDPYQGLAVYLNDREGGQVVIVPPGAGESDADPTLDIDPAGSIGLQPNWRQMQ